MKTLGSHPMADGTRLQIILTIAATGMLLAGSWALYENDLFEPEFECGENMESIDGICVEIDIDVEDDKSQNITAEDCNSQQVWRFEACVPMVAPNGLSYENETLTLETGVNSSFIPSFSGDGPDSWTIFPALPTGLVLNTSTGVISGSLSEEYGPISHTISAANAAGFDSTILDIIVIQPVPVITYAEPFPVLIKGEDVVLSAPTLSDALSVDSWTVEPTLPAGLYLAGDGSIRGAPEVLGTSEHSIIAANSGGEDSLDFTLIIIDVKPSGLTYSAVSFSLTKGEYRQLIPASLAGGEVVEWDTEPALPNGLTIDSTSGVIHGEPTALSTLSWYVIWANNSGGSTTATLMIEVIDVAVSDLHYSVEILTLALNIDEVNLTPAYLGGEVVTWNISGALPVGLTFDYNDGKISGVASELWNETEYDILATNSGGADVGSITISVVDLTPLGISWPETQIAIAANESIHLKVNNTGPAIDTWEVHPSLPLGLSLNDDGSITGSPLAKYDWDEYTIFANNSGGSFNTSLTLAVHDLDVDWLEITENVTSIDYGSSWPSLIMPIGKWTFPIGIDWDNRPLISAGHVGLGRVAGYGHEGFVAQTSGDKGNLSLNILNWVCDEGVNVALAARYNDWQDELESAGYSVTTDAQPDALSGQDCFVGEFWNSWDDAKDRAIEQFMLTGGGVVLGGHSWYWSYSNPDVAHNYPGNQIFPVTGLFVSSSSGSTQLSFAADPPSKYHRTAAALDGVEQHMISGPQLAAADADIAAKTVGRAVSVLTLDFEGFWSRAREISNVSGWIEISSSNIFEIDGDEIEDLVLLIQEKLMLNLPATELVAHPSAIDFPGLVPTGSPRVNQTVTVDGDYIGLPSNFGYAGARAAGRMSTGLYAAPGEVVNISLPGEVVDQNVHILIGAHTDSLWGKTEISRHPKVTRNWQVDSSFMQVANSFGGVIYITFPPDSGFGTIDITIENAVQMPYYIHGVTSLQDWNTTIRHYPAPYAELQSDYFILTVPSTDIRDLDDPDYAMDFWDEALQMEHNLSGYLPWTRVERAVFDVQISAGWMHSGYPFMAHHASVAGVVNGSKMYQDGDWGMFHELGHNHQWGPATLPGTTETTCNLYSVKLMSDLVGKPPRDGHSALNNASAKNRVETHFDNGAPLSSWSVWIALETYLQIQEEFGWEPITAAYAEYYYNYSSQPSGSTDEFNQWALQISLSTEHNLIPFLEAWNFPITQTTRDAVDHLPVWNSDPLRGWVFEYDPIIRSLSESNLSVGEADLDFEIYDNGTNISLDICWGLVDGGNVSAAWTNCDLVGAASVGFFKHEIGGLVAGQTYYWRVMGERDTTQTWSDSSSFTAA
jgi:hypothetical protein